MAKKSNVQKNIKKGHLLKEYGSWMYCDRCGKTVGYLCYTTYSYFEFIFKCKCGNEGYFELQKDGLSNYKTGSANLIRVKNRLCCPNDKSPLFSIVEKHIEEYNYKVICQGCNTEFKGYQ